MAAFDSFMQTTRPFLTDGGMETWLFFQQGFEAPAFAAITLMEDEEVRGAMRSYFDGFLAIAEAAETGFVLDTNTWRGCVAWADTLGTNQSRLLDLSREACRFAADLRGQWIGRVPQILLNGVIGPAGDAYSPDYIPTAAEAKELHQPQVAVLAEMGVDMISALTMTSIAEATGIARAATEANLPVVISFTVETDGRLPSGDLLGEAIEAVDRQTGAAPAYYMVNCAHPDHFRETLASGSGWSARIGGLRANASRLSHAELDVAEELDQGNPEEFGQLNGDLSRLLPNLRVVGGCCGTDHRHVGCAAKALQLKPGV